MRPTNIEERETIIWEGSPRWQAILPSIIFGVMFSWLVFPAIYALMEYWENSKTLYTVSDQRIKIKRGIFNYKTDELELYRIRDYAMTQPFWYRGADLGRITIYSTDRSSKKLVLDAVPGPDTLMNDMRRHVERLRGTKRRIV